MTNRYSIFAEPRIRQEHLCTQATALYSKGFQVIHEALQVLRSHELSAIWITAVGLSPSDSDFLVLSH